MKVPPSTGAGRTADLESKQLCIRYRSDAIDAEEIETAVTRLGYRVRTKETA